MTDTPFMPKATAVWLVENTTLTFKQIAEFCNLHELEVKGIADGDVAKGIKAYNPILAGQLSRDEIETCSKNPEKKLKLLKKIEEVELKERKKPKYTPLSKRQDRPDAVYWLIRNHPELKDSQIARLVGSTKNTIDGIRNRTNWNMNNIRPQDPVGLGLCKQVELDEALAKAERSRIRAQKKKEKEERLLAAQKEENSQELEQANPQSQEE